MTDAELAAIEKMLNESTGVEYVRPGTYFPGADIDMRALIAEVRRLREELMDRRVTRKELEETNIEPNLRQMISRNLDIADLYKQALGTIVELQACIEDWRSRSLEWCAQCEDERSKLLEQVKRAEATKEDYARHLARKAFLDGADWLEHRLRGEQLSAYYTRKAWDEACKRWGEEERNG